MKLLGLSERYVDKEPSNQNIVSQFSDFISNKVNWVLDGTVGKVSDSANNFLKETTNQAIDTGLWSGIAGLAVGAIASPALSYVALSALATGAASFKLGSVAGGLIGAVKNITR